MQSTIHEFKVAPWPPILWITSLLASAVLLSVAYATRQIHPYGVPVAVIPLLILTGSVLCIVRDYRLSKKELQIRRLLWTTHIPLTRVKTVRHDMRVLKNSIRTFGNGGLFSFTGRYRSRVIGSYRLFATDLKKAVVIECQPSPIVITPQHTSAFIHTFKQLFELDHPTHDQDF